MKNNITRRDFLKTAGLLSLGLSVPKDLPIDRLNATSKRAKNILIVVFDAFSASNISLYGYPRNTTPHLKQLAKRAVVYHNHYAGGSFTTPGTASLMTGALPWTHRAFTFNDYVDKSFINKSIFHVFSDFYKIAYTQNGLVDTHLRRFQKDIDDHMPQDKLCLMGNRYINALFASDPDTATMAWSRTMKKISNEGSAYSLFFSYLYQEYVKLKIGDLPKEFPRGLPNTNVDNYFRLEDAVNWLNDQLPKLPQPFFGYFHFLPPHQPYNTRRDFYKKFARDDFQPPEKPISIFNEDKNEYQMDIRRTEYDEYLLYVDEEFNRLIGLLEKSGLLDNTWVILTSDHGEMFERGMTGHMVKVLNQPVIHIPLLILEPGKTEGKSVFEPTSAIDLLPTLAHVTGLENPEWCEGIVLPPFNNGNANSTRDIYVLEAKHNDGNGPFRRASVTLVKDGYKLIYYFGYEELKDIGDLVELYDIQNDPEELENLYPARKVLGDELLAEVKAKLVEVNAPYL